MRPLRSGEPWTVVTGDAFAIMASLTTASVDAVVTDPPYGLGFAGQAWDGRDIARRVGTAGSEAFEAWTHEWGQEVRRVLKPGGHLAAFGSPRTAHRLTAGLEDAGLEIRDQLMWLHAQGVPKTGTRKDGTGTTLKPSYEPIILARAPLTGTVALTVERFGTGVIQIEASRMDALDGVARHPGNLLLTHAPTCGAACFLDCPIRLLDADGVSRSRFFFTAKPSRRERDAGCEALPPRTVRIYGGGPVRTARNPHPTVKPVTLMRWVVGLVTPPGGIVLDPFAGSGTTGIAAAMEGRRFLGIEQDAGYAAVARARITHAVSREESTEGVAVAA